MYTLSNRPTVARVPISGSELASTIRFSRLKIRRQQRQSFETYNITCILDDETKRLLSPLRYQVPYVGVQLTSYP